MAFLYIEEFGALGDMNLTTAPFRRLNGEIPQIPELATQQIAIGVGSVASAAFNANTVLVRLNCDVICCIAWGTAPTAITTSFRMAANQTEYFSIPQGAGYKVATINALA
jgi:hypothetical protein